MTAEERLNKNLDKTTNINAYDRLQKNIQKANSNNTLQTVTRKNAGSGLLKTPENFKDGYQFGDITKTAISTAGDLAGSGVEGILRFGEGLGDLAQYGVAGVADFFGADNFADSVRKNAQQDAIGQLYDRTGVNKLNENSLAGDTINSVAQGVGNVIAMANAGALLPKGMQSIGTKNFKLPTTSIISGMGSGMSEAYNNDATDGEAFLYGLGSGLVEGFSESLFGGLGSKYSKVFGGGALDDVAIKSLTNKIRNKTLKVLAESGLKAVGEGTEEVISGYGNAIIKKLTYLSDEDFKKIVKDENLLEQFIMGTLTSAVMQTPGTINSIKTGNDYISNENVQNNTNTPTNETNTQNDLNTLQGDTTNRYTYLPTNNQKSNNLRQSATQYFSNSQEAINMVDTMDKVVRDKGYNVLFDNTIVNSEGESVNAQIKTLDNGEIEIKINPNSERAGEFLLTHEITHAIETDSMKQLVMDYASKNAGFNEALESLKQTYGVEDVTDEVLADISGQLFGNQEFINNLSMEQPSIFRKIYNKIVELANKITGNSKESLFIKDLKNKWETAYRNTTTEQAISNLGTDLRNSKNLGGYLPNINTSTSEISKFNITDYNNLKEVKQKIYDYYKDDYISTEQISKPITNIDTGLKIEIWKNGILETFGNAKYYKNLSTTDKKIKLATMDSLAKMIKYGEIRANSATNYHNSSSTAEYYYLEHPITIDGNKYMVNMDIRKVPNYNGRFYIHSIDTKKVETPGTSKKSPLTVSTTDTNISQNTNNVKYSVPATKYSMQESAKNTQELDNSSFSYDNQGRTLTKEQQEYFKDSKVRDENGNLLTVYHTMTDEGIQFNEFNPVGTPYYRFGDQVVNYYTNSQEMSGSYANQHYTKVKTNKLNSVEEAKQWVKNLNETEKTLKPKTFLEWKLEKNSKGQWIFYNDGTIKTPFSSDDDMLKKLQTTWEKQSNIKHKYQYEGYVKITNPYIVDAEGKNWDSVSKKIDENIEKEYKKVVSNEETKNKLINLYKESQKRYVEYINSNDYKYDKYLYEKFNSLPNKVQEAMITADLVGEKYTDFIKEWDNSLPIESIKVEGFKNPELTIDDFTRMAMAARENIDNYGNPNSYFKSEYENITGVLQNISGDKLSLLASINFEEMGLGIGNLSPIDILGEKHSTNDIVKQVIEMNKNGANYDGLIIKNTYDYGGASDGDRKANDVYVTFNSNQFKNTDNTNPTLDSDIRYSQQDNTWQEHLEKNYKATGTRTDMSKMKGALPRAKAETKTTEVKKVAAPRAKKQSTALKKYDAQKIADIINETIKQGDTLTAKQRRWIDTSTQSDVVDGKVKSSDLDIDKITYVVKSNKSSLESANTKLNNLGYEDSVKYVQAQLNSKNASTEDIVLAERLIQEAIKKGDNDIASDLIMDTAILGTDLGQRVQALSLINRLTPEGQLKMLQKIVKREQSKGNKGYENVEITPEMVNMILEAYNQDGTYDQQDLNTRVETVKQEIAAQMKTTTMEKVDAWRYLSMLGNPKTHIRNVVSNVAMMGTIKVKNAFARTGEMFLPTAKRTKIWKKSSDVVSNYAKQVAQDMKSVITGEAKYSDKTSIEAQKQVFKSKVLEKARQFNSNMLEGEDWFFSKNAFTNSFKEYLTAQGIKTQQDIDNNQKTIERAKKYAVEQAEIATFRQYSQIAGYISKLENRSKFAKGAIGAVLPFKKTPINVAKTGVKYSPLGLIKSISYDAYQVKKGNMEASQMIDNMAQGVTGTSLALIGYALAKAGFLHGVGDDDKEGKYDLYLGTQAYSITIGDQNYSLSWLSPIAMPLFVGANAYETLEEQQGWDMNATTDMLAQTLDPLSEMSFLSSLDSALSSYDSGAGKFMAIGENAIQSYVGQFFPTLFSQFASTLDDKKRTTKASNNTSWKFGEETFRKIAYKIPGLRNQLEASTDIWGNEIEQSNNIIERAFENFISPASRKEDISSGLDTEIKKVYSEVGNTEVIPGVPYGYIQYKGEKYDMSASEYTQYKKTYGQTANEYLNKLIKNSAYKNASYEEKSNMIGKVYDYARDKAKQEYLKKQNITYTNSSENNIEVYKDNAIVDAINNNISLKAASYKRENPEKYSAITTVTDYDTYAKYAEDIKKIKDTYQGTANTSIRKQKIFEYLNKQKLTKAQKEILYGLLGGYSINFYKDDIYNYINSQKGLTKAEKTAIWNYLYR